MAPQVSDNLIAPLRLNGQQIDTASGLAECIIAESDDQVLRTPLATDEQRDDFRISCDALNLWRMCRRVDEEQAGFDPTALRRQLSELICGKRGYHTDEFEFALEATKERARTAFGLGPLQQAHLRAERRRIRLLDEQLKESPLAAEIASIAFHLQAEVGRGTILLPIEQLRITLERRKVVISGAVRRLVDCGVLELVDDRYHTRRAREYRFVGEEGKHFEFEQINEDDH